MKPDDVVAGAVIVALAVAVLLVVSLRGEDSSGHAVVEGLAGPVPVAAPKLR